MENKFEVKKFIISMFPTEQLGWEKSLNKLLDIFEQREEFAPTHWGISERPRLKYDRNEILRKVLVDGETEIFLHRNKAPKYTGYFDTRTDNMYRTSFDLEFDKSMANKYWKSFFNFSDEIAEVVEPRFGVANIVWDPPAICNNEYEHLINRMFYSSQPAPVDFFSYGPEGVAMRTYFSNDVLQLFTKNMLLKAPAIVSEFDWGGVCINLSKKPWEEEENAIIETWLKVMNYLESAQVFAIPRYINSKYIKFSANNAWKNKDQMLAGNNLNSNKDNVGGTKNDEIVEESKKQKALNKIREAQYKKETLENFAVENIDLSFSDLTYLCADRLRLIKVNLRAATFIDINFYDCRIEESNLENCDFESAGMAECYFINSNFSLANMKRIIMNASFCTGSYFDEVDFSQGELVNTCMDKASVKKANLKGVNAKGISFNDSDLTGSDLSDGNFIKAYFKNANLSGTNLSGSNFEGANFTNAKLEGVIWKGANIKNAIFDEGAREEIEKMI